MKSAQRTEAAYPTINDDGTLSAIVDDAPWTVGDSLILPLRLPATLPAERLAGRYFLARCTEDTSWARTHDWSLPLRRTLYVADRRALVAEDGGAERWRLTAVLGDDAGLHWLAERSPGTRLNLIGPLGNGFELSLTTRNLLVLAAPARLPALLPLVHAMLDRGGHVTVLLHDAAPLRTDLLRLLPMAVETRQAGTGDEWLAHVDELARWADYAALALPATLLPALATQIKASRLRLDRGFAGVLTDVPLPCTTGACHGCLVALGNGRQTRACVHGPVFDLADLVRL